MHPTTNKVKFVGKIWTIDSWDGEKFTVSMKNQDGAELVSRDYQAWHNQQASGQERLQCPGTISVYQSGFFEIELETEIDDTITEVHVYITNTLDQGPADESIGYGSMRFYYEFDPEGTVFPTESPASYDHGVENPTGLWENDCSATQKQCAGFNYYGGFNECAQGHQFWRTFYRDHMHPNTNRLHFTGMIWTIDSWDGETFSVEMRDQNDNVMATQEFQGNNFANMAD
jgi:hypothetical protein